MLHLSLRISSSTHTRRFLMHSIISQLAAAVIVGVMSIAPAAFAADLENGAQVFAGNCAACHAGGNNVIQNEKVRLRD